MKKRNNRHLSAVLAVCLAANVCFALPIGAEEAASAATTSSVVETLLEVPILGGILRLFMGGANTGTAETATPETATPETATSENATPENATKDTPATPAPTAKAAPGGENQPTAEPTVTQNPVGDLPTATPAPTPGAGATPAPIATPAPVVTPAPGKTAGTPAWPAAWMAGSVAAGHAYPAGAPDAAAATAGTTLWGGVTLVSDAVVRVNNREETNLGRLTADAVAMAAASGKAYNTNAALENLPVIALVNGNSFTGVNLEPGAALDAAAAEKVLADKTISLVVATPKKLAEVLSAGMQDMLNASGAGYGNFLQVSGLRYTYEVTGGVPTVRGIWLADPAGEKALDLQDTATRLAVALPADTLDIFGLNAAAGYADYLRVAGDAVTLRGALAALPQNCDAATLATLLASQSGIGRILPVSAAAFDAVPLVGSAYAGRVVTCLVDGRATVSAVDADGRLSFTGLSAGFHTLRMKEGEAAYYVSNITGIGSRNGTDVVIVNLPQENMQVAPTAVPTAAPTPAPTAAPENKVDSTNNDSYGTVTGTAAPVATAAPAPAATPRPAKATAVPVKDPSAGTVITTPAPTLAPTPSPVPTAAPTPSPAPTPDPAEIEKLQQAEHKTSQLPLYIGLAALLGCGVVLAGVLLKRRAEENRTNKRRQGKRRP